MRGKAISFLAGSGTNRQREDIFLHIVRDLKSHREDLIRRARLRGERNLARVYFVDAFDGILAALSSDDVDLGPLMDAAREERQRVFGLLLQTLRQHSEVEPDLLTLLARRLADAANIDLGQLNKAIEDTPLSHEDDAFAPRPTLVFDLDEFRQHAIKSIVASGPRILLRARALSDAGVAAFGRELVLPRGITELPASPDERLFTHPSLDAASELVRLGAQFARAPDVLVVVTEVGDEENGLIRAVVRAGTLLKSHINFALSATLARQLDGLIAPLPAADSDDDAVALDPHSPFVQDRLERSALLPTPIFAGRESLLHTLNIAFSSGERALHLYGPSGIGKRSVARALLRQLGYDDDTAPVFWGAADTQNTPLAALVAMMRTLCGLPLGEPEVLEQIEQLADDLSPFLDDDEGTEFKSLLPILAKLYGIDSQGRMGLLGVRRLITLTAKALSKRAGRPAFFILGRAEFLSAETRDVLAHLGRTLGDDFRLLALGQRKWRAPKALEPLALRSLRVPPLDEDDARTLVDSMLGETPDDLFSLLYQRSKGVPLALIHALRLAVESGRLRTTLQGVESELKASDVPTRAPQILQRRVELLSPLVKNVLSFSGALGHSFSSKTLFNITRDFSIDDDDAKRALSVLSQTGFLSESQKRAAAPAFERVDAGERFSFVHPLLREAAQGALDPTEKLAAEGAVAHALEGLGEGAFALASQIADHHEAAHQPRRALIHLERAGQHALKLRSPERALEFVERALNVVVADDPRRCALLFNKERALSLLQQNDAQDEVIEELTHVARQQHSDADIGRALLRKARAFVARNDPAHAENACVEAMEHLRLARDNNALAECCRVLALARFERRDLAGATHALQAAKGHTAPKDLRAKAIIAQQLGSFLLEAGDAHAALEHLLESYSLRTEIADRHGQSITLGALADVYFRTGRLHTAIALYDKANALRKRWGDEEELARGLKNLARVRLVLGDDEGARDLAREAREIARSLGLDHLEKNAAILVARTNMATHDFKSADVLLDNVRRRTQAEDDPFAAMEAALYSAQTKCQRAKDAGTSAAKERLLNTALERAKRATHIGEECGYATGQVLGLAVTAEVLLERDDIDGAMMHAQRAAEMLDDRQHTSLPIEDVYWVHARVLEAQGEPEEALLTLDRAHASLERRSAELPKDWRMRFWQARTRPQVVAMRERLRTP